MNLLKSTSLAYLMTVKDITAIAKTKAAYGYNYIEAYLVIFFIYIILCTLVQLLFKQIETVLSRHKGQQTTKPTAKPARKKNSDALKAKEGWRFWHTTHQVRS